MILTIIGAACLVLFAVAIVVAVLWYRHLIAEGAEVERRDRGGPGRGRPAGLD